MASSDAPDTAQSTPTPPAVQTPAADVVAWEPPGGLRRAPVRSGSYRPRRPR